MFACAFSDFLLLDYLRTLFAKLAALATRSIHTTPSGSTSTRILSTPAAKSAAPVSSQADFPSNVDVLRSLFFRSVYKMDFQGVEDHGHGHH